MTFTNPQLATDELPDIETIEFQSVDSRYPVIVSVIAAAYVVVVCAVLLVASVTSHPDNPVDWPAWVTISVMTFILIALPTYCYFRARSNGYAVRAHDVLLRHGVFRHTEIVQPLIRLQHVEMERGPIDKWAGLAKLKLFSAGAMRETFTIPGLPLRTAARIRRYVLKVQRAQN